MERFATAEEPLLAQQALPRSVSACVLAEGASTEKKQARYRKTRRRLEIALALSLVFMVVEVVGGLYAHSLAILTDAAHLLSDVSGFAVSIAAAYFASVASASHYSFGHHRMEVLGALASVASVWLVTGVLLWEAVLRVQHPQTTVDGRLMFVLALVGVAVNLALIWVLGGHHHGPGGHSHGEGAHAEHGASQRSGDGGALDTIEEGRPAAADAGGHAPGSSHGGRSHDGGGGGERNINVRGAVIHVVGDLVQSLGVAVAGALIWAHPGDARWALADPVCTFVFAALVLWTTLDILRDIADVLMERTPRGVSADAVSRGICGIEGVADVHDLHVWSLTPGIPLLAAHVALRPGAAPAGVLRDVTAFCRRQGIDHTTIQLVAEGGDCPCGAEVAGGGGGAE